MTMTKKSILNYILMQLKSILWWLVGGQAGSHDAPIKVPSTIQHPLPKPPLMALLVVTPF